MSESRTLAREGGSEREHEKEKSQLHSKKRRVSGSRGRADKENLPRKSRRKHERVSGRKSSPGESGKFWYHSKSGQT